MGLGTNDLDVSINLISEKPIEITYKTHSISPFIESTPTISQIVTTLNIQQTITSNESVAQFPSVIIKQGTVSNSEITASISESKINPTKHQITLDSFSTSNLPSLLTFKKPFSPNWRLTELNNQKPVVAYGLVNGWFVNQLPLSAAIEYLPQQYFYIGSIISLITLGVIIVIWTIVRRKKFPNKLF